MYAGGGLMSYQNIKFIELADPSLFNVYASFTLTTTNSELVAATANYFIYITDIVVTGNSNTRFTFVEKTADPTTKIVLSLLASDSRGIHFRQPMKCSVGVNFGISTNAAVTDVYVAGFKGR